MPWIGFVFLMVHMSINHVYRQFASTPSNVDITGEVRRYHSRCLLTKAVDVQERKWYL